MKIKIWKFVQRFKIQYYFFKLEGWLYTIRYEYVAMYRTVTSKRSWLTLYFKFSVKIFMREEKNKKRLSSSQFTNLSHSTMKFKYLCLTTTTTTTIERYRDRILRHLYIKNSKITNKRCIFFKQQHHQSINRTYIYNTWCLTQNKEVKNKRSKRGFVFLCFFFFVFVCSFFLFPHLLRWLDLYPNPFIYLFFSFQAQSQYR